MSKNVIIVYDPANGVVVPDLKAEEHILSLAKEDSENPIPIGIGTALMLLAARSLHKEGKVTIVKILDATNSYSELKLDKDSKIVGTYPFDLADVYLSNLM